MRKMIFVAFCLFLLSSQAFAGDAEKMLLTVLEKLRGGAETGLTYEKYVELLSEAQRDFNAYVRVNRDLPLAGAFPEHIKQSLAGFESARDNWKQKAYWRKEEIVFEKNDFWSSAERCRENQRKYEKLMQEELKKVSEQLELASRDMQQRDAEKAAMEKKASEETAAMEKKSQARKKPKAKKSADESY
jgi:hypothetical protein